jgi:biopolymer transport protein ExbD
MEISRQKRTSLRMEMSPLIDCIFQLLIFFMLSSTFLTPAIKLTLPTATAEASQQNPELLITLDATGRIYVNTEQVAISELSRILQQRLATLEKKVVTIRGDKAMQYEHFVTALDAAKRAGAVHVNISHDRE